MIPSGLYINTTAIITMYFIINFNLKNFTYLATFKPRKNFAMSWSDDCQGRPLALTTQPLSTSSSFELNKYHEINKINLINNKSKFNKNLPYTRF